MIPTQDDGEAPIRHRLPHRLEHPFTGFSHCLQVAHPARADGAHLFRDRHDDVSSVLHLVTQALQAGLQTSVADGAGPHVHAAPPLPQVHRHAQDADRASHLSSISFP